MTRHETPLSGLRKRDVVYTSDGDLDYVRSIIARSQTDNNPIEAVRYSAARWGENSRAHIVTKANVPGVITQADGGSQLISAEGAAARAKFFDAIRAESILGKVPFVRLPFRTATLVQDEGPRVEWRDEGAAYRNTPIKLSRVTGLEPYSLGSILVILNEVLMDSTLETERWVRDQMVRALALKLDQDLPDEVASSPIRQKHRTSGEFLAMRNRDLSRKSVHGHRMCCSLFGSEKQIDRGGRKKS